MMISRPSTDHQFAGQLIVGTDGSLESDGAARWAVADAARHHLDVVLAHGYAVADRHRRAGTRTLAALRLEHEQRVEQAASRLIVPPDMVVHRLAEPTEPATLLARLSRVAGAVVIGQHQRASTPVPDGKIHAVVASAGAAPVVSVPATWQASLDRRPVMVALDGHRTSASTLAYAFDQAAARQVALLAIHAVPLHEIPSDGDGELRNLAEVLAGWKGEHPDQEVRTTLAAGSPRDAEQGHF